MRHSRDALACFAAMLIAPTVGAQTPAGNQNPYFQRAEEERAKFQERIRALQAKPDAGMERRGPWGLLSLLGPAAPEKAAVPPPAPPPVVFGPPPLAPGVWVQGPSGPVPLRRAVFGLPPRPWVPPPSPPGP